MRRSVSRAPDGVDVVILSEFKAHGSSLAPPLPVPAPTGCPPHHSISFISMDPHRSRLLNLEAAFSLADALGFQLHRSCRWCLTACFQLNCSSGPDKAALTAAQRPGHSARVASHLFRVPTRLGPSPRRNRQGFMKLKSNLRLHLEP